MFSYAVSTAAKPLPCGTMAIPRAAASGRAPTGTPSTGSTPVRLQRTGHRPQQ